jgi:hypothetical protein
MNSQLQARAGHDRGLSGQQLNASVRAGLREGKTNIP